MPGLPNWLPGHVLGVGTATPVVQGRRRVHFQKTRQLWLLGTSWSILLRFPGGSCCRPLRPLVPVPLVREEGPEARRDVAASSEVRGQRPASDRSPGGVRHPRSAVQPPSSKFRRPSADVLGDVRLGSGWFRRSLATLRPREPAPS